MKLDEKQQAILNGIEGDVKAKVMKTLVMYGDAFGAEKMVPVTGKYNHLVTSFGLSVMSEMYSLMDKLIEAGAVSEQKFSVDPRPIDKNIPTNLMQKLFFKIMYSKQESYENQLNKLGLMDKNAFTCACYFDEVGNKPQKGEVLSWAESSAVVYANSVLGARCNRNSGIIDLFGSVVGYVPYFGLLTDEGRKAEWIIEVKCKKLPQAQILGSAIGMMVMEEVPYIKGLDKHLGNELNENVCSYLKNFGAATASNGAVGLYHIEGLTPEAVEHGQSLINSDAKIYVIDDAELERVYKQYPCIWKDASAKPAMCFVGCPHLSIHELKEWTEKIEEGIKKNNRSKVALTTVLTSAPAVIETFEKTEYAQRLKNTGVILSYICPLMFMNNPQCGKMPVITNSNKLRTYTSAKYHTDQEVLGIITGGDK